MPTINDAFVDYDLTIVPEGQTSGWIEQPNDELCAGVETDDFERILSSAMIQKSDWHLWADKMWPLLTASVQTIHSQGREGSCVANALAQGVECAMYLQFGPEWWRELSPMSLYERIGRSPNSGAYIPNGVTEVIERGILPVDNDLNREKYDLVYPPRGFNPRRLNALDWKPTAKLFRARFLRINSPVAWFSALMRGKPIIYGRSGHAICSIAAAQNRGKWFFAYVNSWGKWGDKCNDRFDYGIGWDSIDVIDRCVGYAVERVTWRPEIPIPTPGDKG